MLFLYFFDVSPFFRVLWRRQLACQVMHIVRKRYMHEEYSFAHSGKGFNFETFNSI